MSLITRSLKGSPLTWDDMDQNLTYLESLKSGWDDMLAQNQMQSADRTANINGYNLSFINGDIIDFQSNSFNYGYNDSWMNLDGSARRFRFGDWTYDYYGTSIDINDDAALRSIDYRAYGSHNFQGTQIDVQTSGAIGNLTDGTWQINNDGSALFVRKIQIGSDGFFGVLNNIESANILNVSAVENFVSIGDLSNDIGHTYFKLDDNAQTQSFNANNGFQFNSNGRYKIGGGNYLDNLFDIDLSNGIVNIGDGGGDVNNTSLSINDQARIFQMGAANGFHFTGGSTIISDGDLSLMSGNAGIFNDGSFITWDNTNGRYTLGSDGIGNLFAQDGYSGIKTLRTNANGDFLIADRITGNKTFYVDQNGLQTVDAVAGFGTMSPSWLLGRYDNVANTVSVSVGGTLINIPTTNLTTVTKTAADNLIASNGLTNGAFYQITAVNTTLYGGTSIILQATSTNTFSKAGSGQFFNPKYNQSLDGFGIWSNRSTWNASLTSGNFIANETVTADNGATATLFTNLNANQFIDLGTGDWMAATTITGNSSGATANVDGVTLVSYPINSTVFWGGKSWTNITGLVGTSTDVLNLDDNWNVIPYTDATQYNTVWDEIKYDYANDLIIYRKDVANNVVSTSKGNEQYNSDNFSSFPCIAVFQWGNSYDYNSGIGVGENTVDGAYCININFSGSAFIYNNLTENSGFYDNTLSSSRFYNNTLSSSRFYNNTLSSNSGFYNNTLSNNSSFGNNTLSNSSSSNNTLSSNSRFNNNTLSSSIFYNNTLSSSRFNNNTLSSSGFNNNNLSSNSGFNNNTLSSNSYFNSNTLQSNSIWQFNNIITGKTLQNITTNAANVSIDISAATDIYGTFSKNIFSRQDGSPRLSYVNNEDGVVIINVDH